MGPRPYILSLHMDITPQLTSSWVLFLLCRVSLTVMLSATIVALGLSSLCVSGSWVFLSYVLIFGMCFIQHFFVFGAGIVHFVMLPEVDQQHLFLSSMFVIPFL